MSQIVGDLVVKLRVEPDLDSARQAGERLRKEAGMTGGAPVGSGATASGGGGDVHVPPLRDDGGGPDGVLRAATARNIAAQERLKGGSGGRLAEARTLERLAPMVGGDAGTGLNTSALRHRDAMNQRFRNLFHSTVDRLHREEEGNESRFEKSLDQTNLAKQKANEKLVEGYRQEFYKTTERLRGDEDKEITNAKKQVAQGYRDLYRTTVENIKTAERLDDAQFQGRIAHLSPSQQRRAIEARMAGLDPNSMEFARLQQQAGSLHRKTGMNREIMSTGMLMSFMFGGWEVSQAASSVRRGELAASLALNPEDAAQARLAGLQGATAGPIGSTLNEIGNIIGRFTDLPTLEKLEEDTAKSASRNANVDFVRTGRRAADTASALRAAPTELDQRIVEIQSAAEAERTKLSTESGDLTSRLNDPADVGFWRDISARINFGEREEMIRRMDQERANAERESDPAFVAMRARRDELERQEKEVGFEERNEISRLRTESFQTTAQQLAQGARLLIDFGKQGIEGAKQFLHASTIQSVVAEQQQAILDRDPLGARIAGNTIEHLRAQQDPRYRSSQAFRDQVDAVFATNEQIIRRDFTEDRELLHQSLRGDVEEARLFAGERGDPNSARPLQGQALSVFNSAIERAQAFTNDGDSESARETLRIGEQSLIGMLNRAESAPLFGSGMGVSSPFAVGFGGGIDQKPQESLKDAMQYVEQLLQDIREKI